MGYSGSSQAENAREKLGTALEALQQAEGVPQGALAVTEHIAQAVGALSEAERASTEPDGKACVKTALSTLSQTMALLQDVKSEHAGVEQATEGLAEVLSSLFPLVNKTNRPPQPSEPARPASASVPSANHTAPTVPPNQFHTTSTVPPGNPVALSSKPPSPQPPKTQVRASGGPTSTTPIETHTAPTVPPGNPVAVSSRPPSPRPPQTPISMSAKPNSVGPSRPASAIPNSLLPPEAPVPGGPRQKVEANIGATTQSNFYVGLSGEIAHGGVFLATYESLTKDESVRMLVTLPGGFEFECDGYVRFVRDPMDFSAESGPGMGIQFEKLGEEARELVLRFIRKRPPIFYDV